jgi:hypothetical protein
MRQMSKAETMALFGGKCEATHESGAKCQLPKHADDTPHLSAINNKRVIW